MCRALQQSLTDYSPQGIGFACPTAVTGECFSRSRRYAALAGGNLCSVAPTSHSAERNYVPSRGKRLPSLVPKECTLFLPWLHKPHARPQTTGPYKDFSETRTKGHSQPPGFLNLKEKTLHFTFRNQVS
ncbi:hypothetical protein GWK47_031804 [Chionoecetes opilio]|uniref:Uncharacterized protein n=1 Tax=Chionoecetes opilio TaxID=41210 RepID=A0A8J5D4P9_CHIOP|nr:hypothetical protein GWK47_031804 [Chionoecetes opilio]